MLNKTNISESNNRKYWDWILYVDGVLTSISFVCLYRRRSIALADCKKKILYLRPIREGVKVRDKILKIQEQIKKDYPDYEIGENLSY